MTHVWEAGRGGRCVSFYRQDDGSFIARLRDNGEPRPSHGAYNSLSGLAYHVLTTFAQWGEAEAVELADRMAARYC